MIKITTHSGKVLEASIKEDGSYLIDGKEYDPDIKFQENGLLHILLDQRSFSTEVLSFDPDTKSCTVRVGSKVSKLQLQDQYDILLHELGMDEAMAKKASDLKAPMPGLVVDVSVAEGDEVKKGDKILVLEAMKMENILKAAADGVVKKINVSKSNAVEKNQVLIEFQ
jgi:acetyl/propionyl-CoA carboxylase alpha subunit